MRNTFQLDQVINLFNTQKYGQIGNLLFTTNFANSNIWQLLLSIYFVCLFGIPVEKRLGPTTRFISLIFLACTLPWIVQFLDLRYSPIWPILFEHPKQNIYFFGQYCIMLALASTYSVLCKRRKRECMSRDYTEKIAQKYLIELTVRL